MTGYRLMPTSLVTSTTTAEASVSDDVKVFISALSYANQHVSLLFFILNLCLVLVLMLGRDMLHLSVLATRKSEELSSTMCHGDHKNYKVRKF